jgi:hypothetical protein
MKEKHAQMSVNWMMPPKSSRQAPELCARACQRSAQGHQMRTYDDSTAPEHVPLERQAAGSVSSGAEREGT